MLQLIGKTQIICKSVCELLKNLKWRKKLIIQNLGNLEFILSIHFQKI